MFQTTFFYLVAENAEPEPLTWEEREELHVKEWGKYADQRMAENPDYFFTDGHTDMGDVS